MSRWQRWKWYWLCHRLEVQNQKLLTAHLERRSAAILADMKDSEQHADMLRKAGL